MPRAPRAARRARARADREGVRPPRGARRRARRRRHRGSSCSGRSGTPTGTGRRRRSTSTSARCAASSAIRAGSRPCAASASACGPRREPPPAPQLRRAGAARPARARGAARDRLRRATSARDLTGKVERDAVAIASLSEDALQGHGSLAPARRASRRATRATRAAASCVVDRQGVSVVDSGAAVPRDFATRPEIAPRSQGTSPRASATRTRFGTNLLYVAEPVASGGVVHGAVRITYPTSAVDARVTRYWLMLAAIAGARARARGARRARARALGHAPAAGARAGGGRGGRRRPRPCARPRRGPARGALARAPPSTTW